METAYILSVFADKVVVIAPKSVHPSILSFSSPSLDPRFGLEGTLLLPDLVKTLYSLSQLTPPTDDQIAQLVEFDADSHLLKIQVNNQRESSKILKFQVFQQIKVLIRVDEGNDRQSIRKLVMTIMTDEALARGLPENQATQDSSQSDLIEEDVGAASRKKRKTTDVTDDTLLESQIQTSKKKKVKGTTPKK